MEYFRRAQHIVPEDSSALVALERLYTRTERWPDLIETLRRKADLVTDLDERIAIRIRIATVWEEMLSNPEEAIAAWAEVLSESGENLQALRALDRLYVARQEYRELADNLQRQLKLTQDPHEAVALLGRRAACASRTWTSRAPRSTPTTWCWSSSPSTPRPSRR